MSPVQAGLSSRRTSDGSTIFRFHIFTCIMSCKIINHCLNVWNHHYWSTAQGCAYFFERQQTVSAFLCWHWLNFIHYFSPLIYSFIIKLQIWFVWSEMVFESKVVLLTDCSILGGTAYWKCRVLYRCRFFFADRILSDLFVTSESYNGAIYEKIFVWKGFTVVYVWSKGLEWKFKLPASLFGGTMTLWPCRTILL